MDCGEEDSEVTDVEGLVPADRFKPASSSPSEEDNEVNELNESVEIVDILSSVRSASSSITATEDDVFLPLLRHRPHSFHPW